MSVDPNLYGKKKHPEKDKAHAYNEYMARESRRGSFTQGSFDEPTGADKTKAWNVAQRKPGRHLRLIKGGRSS